MPVTGSKGRKKSRGNRFERAYNFWRKGMRNRGREFEDIVVGLPSGARQTVKALDQALPRNPVGLLEGLAGETGGRHNDPRLLKEIAGQTAAGMRDDIRHPLRNPTSTALTLLGLASLTGGAAVRGATGVSAARKVSGRGKLKAGVKAAAERPVSTRAFGGIAKKPGQFGTPYPNIPASPNPLARGVRAVTLDPAYKISKRRAEQQIRNPKLKEGAKVVSEAEAKDMVTYFRKGADGKPVGSTKKGSARREDLLSKGVTAVRKKSGVVEVLDPTMIKNPGKGRYARRVETRERQLRARLYRQQRGATSQTFDTDAELRIKFDPKRPNPRNRAAREARAIEEIIGLPMNAVRGSMYVRPRYAVQNAAGTMQLLLHQLGRIPKNVVVHRQLKKNYPETLTTLRNAMGETGTQSYSIGAMGRGSDLVRKLGGVMQRPEGYLRKLALIDELDRVGARTPKQIDQLTRRGRTSKFQLAQRRANEAVVDYNRLGDMERAFMRSQIPIFYPMFKGFTRYAAKFPLEHSIQSALFAQLGQQGREVQKEQFGGVGPNALNPYLESLRPGTTRNVQNMYAFSPGADVIRQAAQTFTPGERLNGLNLLQMMGPLPDLVLQSQMGRDPVSGFELEGLEEGQSPGGAALRGFADFSIPGADYARMLGLMEPRSSKTYPTPSKRDMLMMALVGHPFYDRPTNTSEIVKRARRDRTIARKRKW